MISMRLRDFRGCERADVECAPIALVAGRNAAGKSSLAQAAGAALYSETLPLAGLTKGSAGLLVKSGASAATVEIKSETGSTRIAWPACQGSAQGQPPHASDCAAGLASIASVPAKDRARVLGALLHADPTREDLAAALADVDLAGAEPGGDKVVEAVWQLIENQGWDGAHILRKEKGAELKGRWRQVTGANYGSRVAATWNPANWADLEDDFAWVSENDLAAAVARAKDVHEKAIAATAVSAAERETLTAAAGQVDRHRQIFADAEAVDRSAAEQLTAAQTARARLPLAPAADPGLACPHCGEKVVVVVGDLADGWRLEKPNAVSPTELHKRRQAIAEADGLLSRRVGDRAAARTALDTARRTLDEVLGAAARLQAMPAADKKAGDVAAAKAALELAQRRWAAFQQKVQADDLYQKIAGNDLVLDILAGDGLRGKKLGRVLDVFNRTQLQELADAAGWAPVTVDAEMTLAYGGRPYALLSTSEQYRVRAVLQLAIARLDGSDMVVLDAADVLDGTTRSGLFAMLEEAGLPALVCMTLTRREQVPDLAAAGLGASYWLEDGVAYPLRQPAEAAA